MNIATPIACISCGTTVPSSEIAGDLARCVACGAQFSASARVAAVPTDEIPTPPAMPGVRVQREGGRTTIRLHGASSAHGVLTACGAVFVGGAYLVGHFDLLFALGLAVPGVLLLWFFGRRIVAPTVISVGAGDVRLSCLGPVRRIEDVDWFEVDAHEIVVRGKFGIVLQRYFEHGVVACGHHGTRVEVVRTGRDEARAYYVAGVAQEALGRPH